MMAGCLSELWQGVAGFAPLGTKGRPDASWRARTSALLARDLYGAIPEAPDDLDYTAVQKDGFVQLDLTLRCGARSLPVSAALWLPADRTKPVPLIAGLDFVGPYGIMPEGSFAAEPKARVYTAPNWGAGGRLAPVLAGKFAYRWPVQAILEAGFALMVSCYGSWVPDDPAAFLAQGVHPLTGAPDAGAISLWAWAISRMVDVAVDLPQIDDTSVAVVGHSRLGKAALWAAAQDTRIAAVWANNSGCAGAAPACHPIGETLEDLAGMFPHWLRRGAVLTTDQLACDQHHLLALCAPRAVYLSEADEDIWADPLGSYWALKQASAAWGQTSQDWPEPNRVLAGHRHHTHGPLGYHLRSGGHDMLPQDWQKALPFLGAVFAG